ncbi:MAG: hypothetical protein Q7T54_05270, partial [Candidatus Levybacteria bacterium]|nr:hypothetical protein [Candidatus Levybacteria bacterium]
AGTILGVALFLRLYRIDQVVPELFGKELEVSLVNSITIPSFVSHASLYLLGMSEFAVRLPGVIVGVLTVALMYYLANEINQRLMVRKDSFFPLFAMGVLSVLPWHIQISRSDLGVSLGLFFFILMVFPLCWFKQNKWMIVVWVLPAAAAFHADIVFLMPVILAVGFISFYHSSYIRKYWIQTVLSVALLAAFMMPFFRSPQILLRPDDQLTYQLIENTKLSQERVSYSMNTSLSKVLYLPIIENSKLFLSNTFSYFQPHSLFFSWDKDQYMNPNFGLFYPVDLLFILLGLAFLKKKKTFFTVSLIYILAIVLYAAFLHGSSQSTWLMPVLPLAVILSSLGFFRIFELRARNKFVFAFVVLIASFCMVRFLGIYYIVENKETLIGEYEEAFVYLAKNKGSIPVVVVDSTYGKNLSLYSRFFREGPNDKEFIYSVNNYCQDGRMHIMPTYLIPKGAQIYYISQAQDEKMNIGIARL